MSQPTETFPPNTGTELDRTFERIRQFRRDAAPALIDKIARTIDALVDLQNAVADNPEGGIGLTYAKSETLMDELSRAMRSFQNDPLTPEVML